MQITLGHENALDGFYNYFRFFSPTDFYSCSYFRPNGNFVLLHVQLQKRFDVSDVKIGFELIRRA